MAFLRLHFQVTAHKQPILAACAHGKLLATLEQGVIRLWSYGHDQVASGGPTLLRMISCPRGQIRALFITPDSSHIIAVLADEGVIMMSLREHPSGGQVLLRLGKTNEDKIIAAAWDRETCSLAISFAAGGLKIYELMPAVTKTARAQGKTQHAPRPNISSPSLTLRHDIVVKSALCTPRGSRRAVCKRIDSLATDDSKEETNAGAGILIGVAEGKHLCAWDMATGSTLLTALTVSPVGCNVEKVVWHGPTTTCALLYSVDGGLRRVDVHQIDPVRQTTTSLFSYLSDVLIAGANLCAAPDAGSSIIDDAFGRTACGPSMRVCLHVIDRLRTFRTWLLHPGGANAIAAYVLPPAAPRVPSAPETTFHNAPRGGEAHPESHKAPKEKSRAVGARDCPNETHESRRSDEDITDTLPVECVAVGNENEETVEPHTLAAGALVAAVLSSGVRAQSGPAVVVAAGVALSGISISSDSDALLDRKLATTLRDGSEASPSCSSPVDGVAPLVLAMRLLVSWCGHRQALGVVWRDQPLFQVLRVPRAGRADVVHEVAIDRRHRDDHLADAPRSDRVCVLTCWTHSIALGLLVCGWSDGVVDVISPASSKRYARLVPSSGRCVAVSATALLPASVFLSQARNQLLSDPESGLVRDDQPRARAVVLVGHGNGTIALWPTWAVSRPWSVTLAHTDAVIAVRTAMDAPRDVPCERGPSFAPAGPQSGREGGVGIRAEDGGAQSSDTYSFYVVTAGVSCEVKVWGIDTTGRRDVSPLVLRGYTVVSGRFEGDHLSALELLSETFMICAFQSGAVELWKIPFASRGATLGITQRPAQAFPHAHTRKVTSISVCVGLPSNGTGPFAASAGRAVLTTASDCTIVRWASSAQGDKLKPVSRYCLSAEPSAATVLPPMVSSDSDLNNQLSKFDRTSPPLFRVVAAMEGVITVLELVTATALIGGEGSVGSIRLATANAFPGSPLVPQLPSLPSRSSVEQETGREKFQWGVGGPRGREAGRYNVVAGVQVLPPEWRASGIRRLRASAVLRKAWIEQAQRYEKSCAWEKERTEKQGNQVDGEPTWASTIQSQCGLHGRRGRSSAYALVNVPQKATAGRRSDMGLQKTTFGEHSCSRAGGGGWDCQRCVDFDPHNAYARVGGGKTVKIDPAFAACTWEEGVQRWIDDDHACDEIERRTSSTDASAQDISMSTGAPSRDIFIAVPGTYDTKMTSSGAADSGARFDTTGIDEWSANPPPLSLSSAALDAVELCESSRSKEEGAAQSKTSAETTMGDMPIPPPSTRRRGKNLADQQKERVLNDTLEGDTPEESLQASIPGEEMPRPEAEKEAGDRIAQPTKFLRSAAAAAAARRAREAWKTKGHLAAPKVVPLPTDHEARQQFNFDSAQAPSAGMFGVGLAVPLGYADDRLAASKRTFVTSAAQSRITRQKVGRKGRLPFTARRTADHAKPREGNGDAVCGENEDAPVSFPTGLVVSKHFRDKCSGREILMLEVEKKAVGDNKPVADSKGHASLSCRPGQATDKADDVHGGSRVEDLVAGASATDHLALSPRSRQLFDVFEALATGRAVLSQDALGKWNYVAQSVERGLISQYQFKSLFRQAHGGRHRGKMVRQDMIAFYEGMEAALDKACAPPLAEDLAVDSEAWDSLTASVYLTKRGDVYVVAIRSTEASPSVPSPETVRNGGRAEYRTGSTCAPDAWATATVTNPDVPARVRLSSLSPECRYDLYAYAENGAGRRGGARRVDGENDPAALFSIEPAPSGMTADSVLRTRVSATTAPEPDEDLDVPWEDLSESEKMTEALAALSDPTVARAAREAALDPPTAEDLAKTVTDPVSRNKWRSFCRWWAGGGSERAMFLLRECIFAAQQPEILEEAARLGVQILEGDWSIALADAAQSSLTTVPTSAKALSARQRRWSAFRSWYRGGRVFDKAHETLIVAAVRHRPPSPGSLGRPLTPRWPVAEVLQPSAPVPEQASSGDSAELLMDLRPDQNHPTPEGGAPAGGVARASTTWRQGGRRTTTPPATRPPPEPKTHVVRLDSSRKSDASTEAAMAAASQTLDRTSRRGSEARAPNQAMLPAIEDDDPIVDEGPDAASLAGIARWEEGEGDENMAESDGEGSGGPSPPALRSESTATAKRLRMEARRKFLSARTMISKEAASKVGRLLNLKRKDVKARRAVAAASGVVARRHKATQAKRKRRRSQVELVLALKRADELLTASGKAQDIEERRGSLGSLRPEDVASIGVFDSFNLDHFDPDEPDPGLFRRDSASGESDSTDTCTREAAAWGPRSAEELTLELQLACVFPQVCLLAASAGIGVPDPEDAFSTLSHRKTRWARFSAWYYTPGAPSITPQRKAFLDSEVSAATSDKIVRRGMEDEGLLPTREGVDVSDFVDWYCEEEAEVRLDFRRRRIGHLLQSRRFVATEVLGYLPLPFVFWDIPELIPPPPPATVQRFRLFPSRSPELFSWADVSGWYGLEALAIDDKSMQAGERAGQYAALLEAARTEESKHQVFERQVMTWEDFRSHLMHVADGQLSSDPFKVGQGAWQFNTTLRSWSALSGLRFECGSGLENRDEVVDALEVARQEAHEERGRVAEVRRQRQIAKEKRAAEEKCRREEEERLRWMRETEERRRLVQQRAANLKRQRALEAERARMAAEERLTLALVREEKRLLSVRLAEEATLAEEMRLQALAAAEAAAAAEEGRRRQKAEIAAMTLEEDRSRELEAERRATEKALTKKTFLRDLYSPFVPLWAGRRNTAFRPGEDVERGHDECNGGSPRPTIWWKGADAPQIWAGPSAINAQAHGRRPGARFVPHAQALLDDLDTQAVSISKLSREYLALIGLPYEAARNMYEQGRWTVTNDEAMLDEIQVGRHFTMHESHEVSRHLYPVTPLGRLRRHSGGARIAFSSRGLHRRQRATTAATPEMRRCHHTSLAGHEPSPLETGRNGCRSRRGIRKLVGAPSHSHGRAYACSSAVNWWGRHSVPSSADCVAVLPLSGDERRAYQIEQSTRLETGELGNGGPLAPPLIDGDIAKAHASVAPGFDMEPNMEVKVKGGFVAGPRRSAFGMVTHASHAKGAQLPLARAGKAPVHESYVDDVGTRPHKQCGGFGPGYFPRFFRGNFGVAGQPKLLQGYHNNGTREGARDEECNFADFVKVEGDSRGAYDAEVPARPAQLQS